MHAKVESNTTDRCECRYLEKAFPQCDLLRVAIAADDVQRCGAPRHTLRDVCMTLYCVDVHALVVRHPPEMHGLPVALLWLGIVAACPWRGPADWCG